MSRRNWLPMVNLAWNGLRETERSPSGPADNSHGSEDALGREPTRAPEASSTATAPPAPLSPRRLSAAEESLAPHRRWSHCAWRRLVTWSPPDRSIPLRVPAIKPPTTLRVLKCPEGGESPVPGSRPKRRAILLLPHHETEPEALIIARRTQSWWSCTLCWAHHHFCLRPVTPAQYLCNAESGCTENSELTSPAHQLPDLHHAWVEIGTEVSKG